MRNDQLKNLAEQLNSIKSDNEQSPIINHINNFFKAKKDLSENQKNNITNFLTFLITPTQKNQSEKTEKTWNVKKNHPDRVALNFLMDECQLTFRQFILFDRYEEVEEYIIEEVHHKDGQDIKEKVEVEADYYFDIRSDDKPIPFSHQVLKNNKFLLDKNGNLYVQEQSNETVYRVGDIGPYNVGDNQTLVGLTDKTINLNLVNRYLNFVKGIEKSQRLFTLPKEYFEQPIISQLIELNVDWLYTDEGVSILEIIDSKALPKFIAKIKDKSPKQFKASREYTKFITNNFDSIAKNIAGNESLQTETNILFLFDNTPYKNQKKDILKLLINAKAGTNIVEWLTNLEPSMAAKIVGHLLDYKLIQDKETMDELYYLSPEVRQLPEMKNLKISIDQGDKKHKQESKLDFSKYKSTTQAITEGRYTEQGMLEKLQTEVLKYANERLAINSNEKQSIAGQVYVAGKNTSSDRAKAVNKLLEAIDQGYEAVCVLAENDSFRTLAGENDLHVSSITHKSFWSIIKTFIETHYQSKSFYQAFSEKPEALMAVLSDPSAYFNLTQDSFSQIYFNIDPVYFAQKIFEVHNGKGFISFDDGLGNSVTIETLKALTEKNIDAINKYNMARAERGIPTWLPVGAAYPGVNANDYILPKEELFQYEDMDINAGEEFLRTQYPDRIVNHVRLAGQLALNPKANTYFHLVPISDYMVLDPDANRNHLYIRYKSFKKDMRQFVDSYNPQQFDKPILFTGVMNVDNSHYVPFFLSKTIVDGQPIISVITVDPSPSLYPKDQLEGHERKDPKLKAIARLNKIFNDIFPGCRYQDASVTQMLRERDCGPDSLQTIADAMELATDQLPLLSVNDQGILEINSDRLTLNGEKERCLDANPEEPKYFYSAKVKEDGVDNRIRWANIFRNTPYIHAYHRNSDIVVVAENDAMKKYILDSIKSRDNIVLVNTRIGYFISCYSVKTQDVMTKRLTDEKNKELLTALKNGIDVNDETLSKKIYDTVAAMGGETTSLPKVAEQYDVEKNIFEYDFDQRVEDQERQDNRQVNMSEVYLILQQNHPEKLEEITSRFQSSLTFPSDRQIKKLAEHIKQFLNDNVRLQSLTEHHNGDLSQLITDVLKLNLSPFVEQAIYNSFPEFINQLESSVNLNVKDVVDQFIYNPKYQSYIQTFSEYKQRSIKENLSAKAKSPINTLLKEAYLEKFSEFFEQHGSRLLLEIPSNLNIPVKKSVEILPYISQYADKNKLSVIKDGVEFFQQSHSAVLSHLINEKLPKIIEAEKQKCIEFTLLFPDFQNYELAFLFKFFKNDNFCPLKYDELSHIAAQSGYPEFQQGDPESFLARTLLKEANATLENEIRNRCGQQLKIYAENYYQNSIYIQFLRNVNEEFLYGLLAQDGKISDAGFIACGFDSALQDIKNNCKITLEINHYFKQAATDLIHQRLHEIYAENVKELLESANWLRSYKSCEDAKKTVNKDEDIFLQLAMWTFHNYYSDNYHQLSPVLASYINIDYQQQTYHFNFYGERFLKYFGDTYLKPILKRYHQVEGLKQYADKVEQLLLNVDKAVEQLADKNVKCKYDRSAIFHSGIEKFHGLMNEINAYDPDQFKEQLNSKMKLLNDYIQIVANYYLSICKSDSLKPGTLAEAFRPALYALMGISSFHGRPLANIIFKDEANEIDEYIKNKIDSIKNGADLHKIADVKLLRSSGDPKVLSVDLGKPITAQVLLDCVMYWRANQSRMNSLLGFGEGIPSVIFQMIQILNDFQFANDNLNIELTENDLSKLLESLSKKVFKGKFLKDAGTGKDAVADIILALTKTSTFTQYYEQKLGLFKISQEAIPEYFSDYAEEFKINDLKKIINTYLNKNNDNKIRIQSIANENGDIPQFNQHRFKAFFQDKFHSNEHINQLTAELKYIRQRHGNSEENFMLDYGDLCHLKLILMKRWDYLKNRYHEFPEGCYLQPEKPQNRVYIALAEYLQKALAQHNEMSFIYDLLMPDSELLPAASKLKANIIPDSIANLYSLVDATVNDIPINKLAITSTGYAFNVDWIINEYKATGKFPNPYVNAKQLTRSEYSDLCKQSQYLKDEVLKIFMSSKAACVTPRAIEALRKLIYGSAFVRGLQNDYTFFENKLSSRAYQKFYDTIAKFPEIERESLLCAPIPGGKETVYKVLKDAATHCITYRAKAFAKLVYQYEPNANFPFAIKKCDYQHIERKPYFQSDNIVLDNEIEKEIHEQFKQQYYADQQLLSRNTLSHG